MTHSTSQWARLGAWVLFIAIGVAMLLGLAGPSSAPPPPPAAPPSNAGPAATAPAPSASSRPAYWRDRWGKDEYVQRIRPEFNDQYINNPHKGTATFQRFNGDPLYPTGRWDDSKGPVEFPAPKNADLSNDHYPPTRISYCRWIWRVLEPEKGKYRFDILDAALKTAAERGQTLQVRLQPFANTGAADVPDWYIQAGGTRAKENRDNEIDHNDPLYLQHWGDLIRAFGKRYDGHPALESLDIAYGGFWGEEGGNATPQTAAKLVDIYVAAFPKTQLLSMLGTPGCKYASTLKDRHIGWRADAFGDSRGRGRGAATRPATAPGVNPGVIPANGPPPGLTWNHMRDAYPMQVQECGVKDAWKYAPVTFESAGTVLGWQRGGVANLDWVLEQGLKYHCSVFMPKSVSIPDEWMPKIMEFNKRLGYNFFIHQMTLPLEAKAGQQIEVTATIDNKGVAPIYRPYHFALRFSQGGRSFVVKLQQDIRTWLPDLTFFRENIAFPAGLTLGEVKIACSIVDDQDQSVVKLAIKPLDPDGWHPLTSMDVVEKQPATRPAYGRERPLE